MNIRKYPANAGNVGSTRAASGIRYIVIHYTGNDGDTAIDNAKYYAGNVVKTSAHYFVDEKEIVQSVDDLRIAWAVGGNKYPSCAQTGGGTMYGKCKNANSISIELCDEKKNGVYAPGAKTVAQALELTKALMKKYNIPASNVIRHGQAVPRLLVGQGERGQVGKGIPRQADGARLPRAAAKARGVDGRHDGLPLGVSVRRRPRPQARDDALTV